MSKAEKYINEHTRNCSNEYLGDSKSDGCGGTISKKKLTPWLTPDQARKAVEIDNLRYQVYELDIKGNLGKPLTTPIPTKERALTYYEECFHCTLVSIDKNGAVIEVLEKNLEPRDIKDKKPKIIKRNL